MDLQSNQVNEAIQRAQAMPAVLYPWDTLGLNSNADGTRTFPLIGYGSLISPESAARTLQHTRLDQTKPVNVFGARRLFNYQMPEHVLERYGESLDSPQSAALNVQVTWSKTDSMNAVLLQVAEDDVEPLRQRELNYDLIAVPYVTWNQDDAAIETAFLLREPVAPKTRQGLLPQKDYTQLCRGACAAISNDFLQVFDETTFLADGTTSLGSYLESTA